MIVLGIDPGPTQTAWCLTDDHRPTGFGKHPNQAVREWLRDELAPDYDQAAVEMIAPYGKTVGREVFDTVLWTGRFCELILTRGVNVHLLPRSDVKKHLCPRGTSRSARTDADVTRALVDRFTPGQPNFGKGTAAAPGWFHGFKADVWAAYAVAVTHADTLSSPTSVR